MVDETRGGAIPDRLDHAAQGVVHDPVAERRGADQATLGFVNIEVVVTTGPVGLGLQIRLQAQQVAFQVKFKRRHPLTTAFARRARR